jgi:PKD repeat protein
MKNFLLILTAVMVFTIQTPSQTIINAGPVIGTWTANGSPYHILGDINVPIGEELVIEPGVTIKIFSELSFKVYGKLLAEGTEADSIFFIPIATYWNGLQIWNATDTCKFRFCSIKNFKNKSYIEPHKGKGGVIYSINSKIIIENSLFRNNCLGFQTQGVSHSYGGAICLENTIALISNSSFFGNYLLPYAEGIHLDSYGGAIYASSGGNIIIKQCQINQNYINLYGGSGLMEEYYSAHGGGIYCNSSEALIENCFIKNNYCNVFTSVESEFIDVSAYSICNGGGIQGFNACVKNCLISENYCNSFAGAYSEEGSYYDEAISYGGGIMGCNSINNTIVLNNVTTNPAMQIYINGSGCFSGSNKNCIVYDNTGAPQISNATTTYSCVQGGYTGLGNISSDPMFINGIQGNYYLKQYPCQTQQSPCVDAGSPTTPLFMGTTRTDLVCDTSIIDMGFHYPCEFYGPTLIADFFTEIPVGKNEIEVHFQNTSDIFLYYLIQYQWDFENDGIIDSYQENPIHLYNEVGNYSVKMILIGQATTGETLTDTMLKENYIHVSYFESGFDQDTILGWYPLTVQFTDTSEVINTTISSWCWDFDNDGLIESNQQNPEYIYEQPGLYTVKQIIIDASGFVKDTTIKEDLILVKQFDAGYIADNTYSEIPLTAHFTTTSQTFGTEITQYEWDFENDGSIDSNDDNPAWTYNEPGNYSVKLILTGLNAGAIITDTFLRENYIHVCYFESGFIQDSNIGFVPFSVQFTDTSALINTQIGIYKWDFDNDGLFDSYLPNSTWTYIEPGTFSVKFIIVDTSGFIKDTTIKEDLILVKQFEAGYIADKTYGEIPLTVLFTNTSQAFGTEITQYEWDFENDGIIDSYEENPTWIFSEPCNYSIKLTLTGLDAGDIIADTLLKESYIHVCYFESGFEQDTVSGWNPLTVQFTDTSNVINTQISSWQWDFDDDGIIDSYLQNPEFVYENIGLYSVKLVITDSSGYIKDTTFKEALINVNGIVADFEADQGMGFIPFLVNFNNTSISHNVVITGCAWDFQNDGIIDSYEENPSWTYSEYGFYSVKLIVTGESTNDLVTDTIIKENFINANELYTEFHSNKTYGHFPLQINFYDDSYSFPVNYGQINSWQWDFQNDGIIDSYVQNPFWTFSEPGLYSVKLVSGNSIYTTYDTILKTNFITVCGMLPGFNAEPLTGDVSLEVNFFDTSFVEYTQISTWKWDFQHDGLIDAYGPNPTWTYPESGIYSVELRITDTSGQIWKSVVKEDYIQVNSITGFPQLLKESINDKLKIYPNPFTNDLIIEFEFDNPDVVTVQIFDVAFKPVATITKDEKVSAGVKNWKWGSQTNNNPSGIYYISLQTFSDKQYIKKCIKVE